jgi:hypothetical protein
MTKSRRTSGLERLSVALAALALLVQVLVPQGFMVDTGGDHRGLVICTSHGPLVLGGKQHPAKSPQKDAPCAFAAHGAAASPPLPAIVAAQGLAETEPPALSEPDLIPGRGLAAPPPPSRGPPLI